MPLLWATQFSPNRANFSRQFRVTHCHSHGRLGPVLLCSCAPPPASQRSQTSQRQRLPVETTKMAIYTIIIAYYSIQTRATQHFNQFFMAPRRSLHGFANGIHVGHGRGVGHDDLVGPDGLACAAVAVSAQHGFQQALAPGHGARRALARRAKGHPPLPALSLSLSRAWAMARAVSSSPLGLTGSSSAGQRPWISGLKTVLLFKQSSLDCGHRPEPMHVLERPTQALAANLNTIVNIAYYALWTRAIALIYA